MNKQEVLEWAETQKLLRGPVDEIRLDSLGMYQSIFLEEAFIEMKSPYSLILKDSEKTFFEEIGATGTYHGSYIRSLRIDYPDSIKELLVILENIYIEYKLSQSKVKF